MVTNQEFTITGIAGQTFTSADQYKAVKVDSSATDVNMLVDLCGANAASIGFLKADSGTDGVTPVEIATFGVCKALAGAAVTVNAYLKTDASGKVIPVTSNNDIIVAQALSAASADAEVIKVRIVNAYYGA